MRLCLGDTLALVGRLTDQPGFDTPRERFRRFLSNWPGTLDDLRGLLDDAQRTPDEQTQRALLDLVITLGRHLGFEVVYGSYDRSRGAVRFDGAWRSPGAARFALEVRTDRSRPFSPTDLDRTIKALPAVAPPVDGEETLGLCVVVPLHGVRRPVDLPHDSGEQASVRVLSLDLLLAMAGRVQARTFTHEDVVTLILAGHDDPRLADLWPTPLEHDEARSSSPAPALSLVPKEQPPDYWIATIIGDEGASPEQFVDAVIAGRQMLGVSAIGIFPADAHAGDWVCFFLPGTGVVGHAQLGGHLEGGQAPLRAAGRFAAIFTLKMVTLYDVPNPLDPSSPPQRLANRTPFDTPGPFLSQIPERDFRALTARPAAHRGERLEG